jgi:hypothetical protein
VKHRFLSGVIVGLALLTGVVSAASNAAVRTAGIGLFCTIVLKASELGHIVYRILISH